MQSKEHWEIDLHGFRRDEALQVLSSALHRAKGEGASHVFVVTGVGRNSDDGVSVLRFAVLSFLNQHGYRHTEQTSLGEFNGVIEVLL